jgi:hypothetical protein
VSTETGEVQIIINESDVREVQKEGSTYSVGVSVEANVLVRIDKLLKATPQPGDVRGRRRPVIAQQKDDKPPITDVEVGPITVTPCLVCGWVLLWGTYFYLCIPWGALK